MMTETQPDQTTQASDQDTNVVNMPARDKEDAVTALTRVVREHPVLVVAGGVAIGAVIAALLPKGTTRKVAARAASMAEVAGAAGLAFGKSARERAESTGEALRAQAEVLGEHVDSAAKRARAFGDDAAHKIERAIAPAGKAAASAGHNIVDRVTNLALRRKD